MPNLQQHPLRTSTIESPHPTRNKPFKRKTYALTILEVQWSIQFPGSSISKPVVTGHGSAPCPEDEGCGGPSGSTLVQATYLDDHIEGKGLAASWVMKPALNQALVDVETHPINSRFGSTWKELNSKNPWMSFFFGDLLFFHWISTSCMGWLEGEIRGGAQQNTWLTCRMSFLLFTWCWDIWFSHCFLLQSTPYLSRCVIVCSTFNPGRMHHEHIHIYIYIHTHTYTTYLRLHSLSSYHIALTCLDYPYLHFWPISFPFLHRPPGFPELLQQELPTRLTFSQEANSGFQSGIGMFCHRQPGYISGRIPHTFLQEIHRRVHDAGYAQV